MNPLWKSCRWVICHDPSLKSGTNARRAKAHRTITLRHSAPTLKGQGGGREYQEGQFLGSLEGRRGLRALGALGALGALEALGALGVLGVLGALGALEALVVLEA